VETVVAELQARGRGGERQGMKWSALSGRAKAGRNVPWLQTDPTRWLPAPAALPPLICCCPCTRQARSRAYPSPSARSRRPSTRAPPRGQLCQPVHRRRRWRAPRHPPRPQPGPTTGAFFGFVPSAARLKMILWRMGLNNPPGFGPHNPLSLRSPPSSFSSPAAAWRQRHCFERRMGNARK
jgi:hypothetical protein